MPIDVQRLKEAQQGGKPTVWMCVRDQAETGSRARESWQGSRGVFSGL